MIPSEDVPVQLVFICGGRGTRLGARKPAGLPKCLVEVGGEPLLARLLRTLAPLHTSAEPMLFVSAAGDPHVPAFVRAHRPDARLLTQAAPDGVASAIALTRPLLAPAALVVLGDVLLEGSFEMPLAESPALVLWPEADPATTRLNFGVRLESGLVREVLEKPADPANLACGLGAYLVTPAFVDLLAAAPPDPRTGEQEITAAIAHALARGAALRHVAFHGHYLNVNTPDDLARAERLVA